MRQIKIIGLILLSIASFIYGYQKPEKVSSTQKSEVYITLEGAFNKTGEVPIKEGMTMNDLVKEVGVKENACMDSLNMNRSIQAEMRLYLPVKRANMISLNKGTIEDFMTLKGVGEKTAQKFIDYRQIQPFYSIEDIMNIQGIGEKKYLIYRDYLCL